MSGRGFSHGARRGLLQVVTAAALSAVPITSQAQIWAYTGQPVSWMVSQSGVYRVELAGGRGGSGEQGAEVAGNLLLHAGESLEIVVAGDGGLCCAQGAEGGGGASWLLAGSQLLAVAGGAGGTDYTGFVEVGGPGLATIEPDGHVDGGTGLGGVASGDGGGGAGWLSNGGGGTTGGIGPPTFAGGASGYGLDGGNGGVSGGFGGGGGAGYNDGGGGGGYTGGRGGDRYAGLQALGGTSYLSPEASNILALSGGSTAGLVSINLVTGAPEPSAWILLILGFGGVGASLRTRHKPAPRSPKSSLRVK